jgi:Arc/MetJ-type ribon-helix-helix transcriptional regulator
MNIEVLREALSDEQGMREAARQARQMADDARAEAREIIARMDEQVAAAVQRAGLAQSRTP